MNDSPSPCRRSTAPFWIAITVLFFSLGFSIFLNFSLGALLFVGGGYEYEDEEYAVDEDPYFEEEWSYGEGDIKAVRLPLEGVIMRDGEAGLLGLEEDMIDHLVRAIQAAGNDEDVGAVVLEVNSPGGGITESDELYQALMRFKATREDRKVVVHMKNLAASGGYYVALAGDWLIAEPTTVVGSIGVIMQALNWKPLSDRIGVSDVTIKSGDNKDLLNPFRETNPEEVALLQDIIDDMHGRFKSLVSRHRGIDPATVDALADGRIFTAGKALESGLIDQIGYWADAAAKTSDLLGAENVRFVRYYHTTSFWDLLAGIKTPIPNPLATLRRGPSFQYRWNP